MDYGDAKDCFFMILLGNRLSVEKNTVKIFKHFKIDTNMILKQPIY